MADFTAGSVLTAAQLDTAFNAYTIRDVSTTSATLGAADAGELLSVNNNSGGTVTIPLNSTWAAETGTHVHFVNAGTAGVWTIAATGGVTLDGTGTSLAVGAAATVYKTATNTWRVLPFSTGSAAAVSGTTGSPTTTANGGATSYSFTGNGDITLSSAGTVKVLYVGGGGASGSGGGGGGGGQVFEATLFLAAGTHSVTVGAGGTGAVAPSQGGNGGASIFGPLRALGGGGGGSSSSGTRTGADGANGGGGGGYNATPANGGVTFSGLGGYSGGTSSGSAPGYGSGGGGGAGGAGGNGASGAGGTAGIGVASTIVSGASVTYGAGGTGGNDAGATPGTAGAANTGNGGSGGQYTTDGVNGGSGLVVILVGTV